MGTNAEIKIRRDKVAALTLQGYSAEQIAKVLKVTSRTIEKDREMHRKNWVQNFRKEPFEQALYKFSRQNDAVCKKAWTILEDTKDEKVKVRCIEAIDRAGERHVRILQSMGIIEHAPEKVELSGQVDVQRIVDIVKGVKDVKCVKGVKKEKGKKK